MFRFNHSKVLIIFTIIHITSAQEASCGLTKSISKIIRGTDTIPNSFSWLVSLRRLHNGNRVGKHFCAGSLIDKQFVLTAAHCVYHRQNFTLAALIGINNLDDELNESNIYRVEKIFINENYSGILNNDIALIKLNRRISDDIPIICVPNQKHDFSIDSHVVAVGWGSKDGLNRDTSLSNVLQQAELKIYRDSTCLYYLPLFKSTNMYCARNEKNLSNICYGDSGGPLMKRVNNKWYIYGVSSMALAYQNYSCNPSKPSYYTKVPYYNEWIRDRLV